MCKNRERSYSTTHFTSNLEKIVNGRSYCINALAYSQSYSKGISDDKSWRRIYWRMIWWAANVETHSIPSHIMFCKTTYTSFPIEYKLFRRIISLSVLLRSNLPNHQYTQTIVSNTRWRHDIERPSASLGFCEENPPVTAGGYPHKGPVMRNFGVFDIVSLNELLNNRDIITGRW